MCTLYQPFTALLSSKNMPELHENALVTLSECSPEQSPNLIGALTALVQFAEEGDTKSLEQAKWFIDRAIEAAQ